MNDTYAMFREPKAFESLPPAVKEAITRFTQRVTAEFQVRIVHVILYGSYAWGDYHEDSDVDLLVLTTDDAWEMKKKIMNIGFDLYPEIGVMVSSKVIPELQYKTLNGFLFFQEISRDGIAVV